MDNKIHYYYRADGIKVKQSVESGSSVIETEYVGPLVYEVVGSTRSLKYIITPEGLAYNNNNTYLYEYHIKDHLDNVRVVLAQDGTIKQTTDYYPYGMKITPLCTSNSDNPYLYNGKEMQNELGLDWYDYGARFYDPALGRFHSIDPMAEDYFSLSPYSYCGGNPIINIDPTGMNYNPIYDKEGEFLGTDDRGLHGKAIVMDEKNFEQGMSHEEALSHSLGAEGLSNDAAKTKLIDHKAGLKDRPDWDGKLTFGEVTKWSNDGSGDPLFVDGSKIDLSPINVDDVKNATKNNNGYIDFFKDGKMSTGLVYGNIKVTLTNERIGNVQLGKNGLLDIHDFKNPVFKAVNDWLYPGKPKDFKIYYVPCNNKVGAE